MFGWLRRRQRREHIKLVHQNILATEHLMAFAEKAETTGTAAPSDLAELSEILLIGLAGTRLAQASLAHNELLDPGHVNDQLQANKHLRGLYDMVLSGRVKAASVMGTANERLLPFDKQFTPNEGWDIFFQHFERNAGR